ncbi:hypothetical protein DFQ27_005344 [Actinomortierella ambigua]|uniref:Uncharacterized protein n=1 Tax=Actinomortierella ambigua TaxID=1343610 RepID=A0A9P6QHQ5_9FUNG|nr:hypothetical protein DFQ27_005344 [Actinomortierella ambigua]
MEILRDEFERWLPDIEKAVAECDFVAMDTEMSGLASPGAIPKNIDSLHTRYNKVAANAANFLVIQLGICTFTWSDDKKAYIARPFNFPCFPASSDGGRAGERFFRCQSTSLEFLIQNGFDFNKWIKHGIPYMTRLEESQFLTRKAEKETTRSQLTDIKIDERNREFYENTRKSIQEWLQTSTEATHTVFAPNSFFRRLVHQIVRIDHGDNLHVTANPQARTMTLQRMTDELRKKIEEARVPKPPMLNLRRVLDMISKARKPLIGHNCFLDLMQITEQYLWELPSELSKWKEMLSVEWDMIMDTKHFANHPTIAPLMEGNTGLENVSEAVRKDPFTTVGPRVVMADGFDRYGAAEGTPSTPDSSVDGNQQGKDSAAAAKKQDKKSLSNAYHEAGYDAFITGQAFLRFAGLAIKTKEHSIQEEHRQKRRKTHHSNEGGSDADEQDGQDKSQSENSAADSSAGNRTEEESDEDGEIVESEEEKRTILSNPTFDFLHSDEVRPYFNRLHMMRSDITVMHLDGPEPEPEDRPLQFMVRNIPSSTKTSALFVLFGKWDPQRFIWIDDTSCWIMLKDAQVSATDSPAAVSPVAKATLSDGTATSASLETAPTSETEPSQAARDELTPGFLGEGHVRPLCVGMDDLAIRGREAGVTLEMAKIEIISWKKWHDDREATESQERPRKGQSTMSTGGEAGVAAVSLSASHSLPPKPSSQVTISTATTDGALTSHGQKSVCEDDVATAAGTKRKRPSSDEGSQDESIEVTAGAPTDEAQ